MLWNVAPFLPPAASILILSNATYHAARSMSSTILIINENSHDIISTAGIPCPTAGLIVSDPPNLLSIDLAQDCQPDFIYISEASSLQRVTLGSPSKKWSQNLRFAHPQPPTCPGFLTAIAAGEPIACSTIASVLLQDNTTSQPDHRTLQTPTDAQKQTLSRLLPYLPQEVIAKAEQQLALPPYSFDSSIPDHLLSALCDWQWTVAITAGISPIEVPIDTQESLACPPQIIIHPKQYAPVANAGLRLFKGTIVDYGAPKTIGIPRAIAENRPPHQDATQVAFFGYTKPTFLIDGSIAAQATLQVAARIVSQLAATMAPTTIPVYITDQNRFEITTPRQLDAILNGAAIQLQAAAAAAGTCHHSSHSIITDRAWPCATRGLSAVPLTISAANIIAFEDPTRFLPDDQEATTIHIAPKASSITSPPKTTPAVITAKGTTIAITPGAQAQASPHAKATKPALIQPLTLNGSFYATFTPQVFSQQASNRDESYSSQNAINDLLPLHARLFNWTTLQEDHIIHVFAITPTTCIQRCKDLPQCAAAAIAPPNRCSLLSKLVGALTFQSTSIENELYLTRAAYTSSAPSPQAQPLLTLKTTTAEAPPPPQPQTYTCTPGFVLHPLEQNPQSDTPVCSPMLPCKENETTLTPSCSTTGICYSNPTCKTQAAPPPQAALRASLKPSETVQWAFPGTAWALALAAIITTRLLRTKSA